MKSILGTHSPNNTIWWTLLVHPLVATNGKQTGKKENVKNVKYDFSFNSLNIRLECLRFSQLFAQRTCCRDVHGLRQHREKSSFISVGKSHYFVLKCNWLCNISGDSLLCLCCVCFHQQECLWAPFFISLSYTPHILRKYENFIIHPLFFPHSLCDHLNVLYDYVVFLWHKFPRQYQLKLQKNSSLSCNALSPSSLFKSFDTMFLFYSYYERQRRRRVESGDEREIRQVHW